MPSTSHAERVDVRSPLSVEEFYATYVNKKPVLMKGALADLPATQRWSLEHFADIAPDLPVRLKTGRVSDGITDSVPLADYSKTVATWEERDKTSAGAGEPPPYLHDVPMLTLIPQLRQDLSPFPAEYLQKFFRDNWGVFPQFFVGPSQAETPLHFDTLLTHNLFYQFHGSKRFLMVDHNDRHRCYTYNWRWSPIDPDAPDLERYPRFRDAHLLECVVEAGDMLYMPPGTLHKVTSLTSSVSFNIDWHDRRSAIRGLLAVRDRMPIANLRYNLLLALGVCFRVPLRALMPALRSYFFYVS